MPEYLAPGVYVEEIEGPGSIQGVSTSTAGFLGFTERGPVKPRLITSITQFINIYGTFFPEKYYLAYFVDGFFRNGGRRCFIARIARDTALSSEKKGIVVFQDISTTNPPIDKTLDIVALGPGISGNNVYFKIQKASNGNPKNFNLTILYFKNKPEHLEKEDNMTEDFFTPDPTHPFSRFLKNKKEPSLVENYADLSFELNSPNYYKKLINGISNLVTLNDVSSMEIPIPANLTPTRLKIFRFDEVGSNNDQKEYLKNFLKFSFGLAWVLNPHVEVTSTNGKVEFKLGTDTLVIERNPATQAGVVLNEKQIYNFSVEDSQVVYSSNIFALEGGRDYDPDPNKPTDKDIKLSDYRGREIGGTEQESTGLKGFEKIDEISIISSPDETFLPGLRSELIDHCENQKFRFAILQETNESTNNIEYIQIDRETKYAAVYIPWLQIFHPETGNKILIPPGGHMAGILCKNRYRKRSN